MTWKEFKKIVDDEIERSGLTDEQVTIENLYVSERGLLQDRLFLFVSDDNELVVVTE